MKGIISKKQFANDMYNLYLVIRLENTMLVKQNELKKNYWKKYQFNETIVFHQYKSRPLLQQTIKFLCERIHSKLNNESMEASLISNWKKSCLLRSSWDT